MKTRRSRIRKQTTRKSSILQHPQIRKATQQLHLRAKQRNKVYTKNWKIQTGGGLLQMEGYTFVYDDVEDHVECLTRDRRNLCFSIDFDKETREIGIVIGYFPNCSVDKDLPESSGTLVMLKTILQYILQRSDITEYTKLTLDDNSHKEIQSFEDGKVYKTRLMDMYFVSTGCTWYSSLAPMFLTRIRDDNEYNKGRKNILTLSWATFLSRLVSNDDETWPMTSKERQTYFVDLFEVKNSNTMACDILNMIRIDRTYSILFYKFIDAILIAMHTKSMFGRNWTIPLRDGKILCPTEPHEVLDCQNKKGWTVPVEYFTYVSPEEYNAVKDSLQIPEGELLEYPEHVNLSRYNPQTTPDTFNEIAVNNNYLPFITGKKDV